MSYRIILRHRCGDELDRKVGDDISDLLHEYAEDGCLADGDTLEIEVIDD